MKKSDVVKTILQSRDTRPVNEKGLAFAPTNIALCKYWGKRDTELNLPVTSSLSIALPDRGAMTTLKLHDLPHDVVIVNGETLAAESPFVTRLVAFLDLFRPEKSGYMTIEIQVNLPIAAGLASSACGFASLVLALNDLYGWQLEHRELSILARLGSGSAARSFWSGFVEWRVGAQPDGMDSYGESLPLEWSELCVGLLMLTEKQKPLSSREAMQRTVDTSALYASWPKKVARDMVILKQAMAKLNFPLFAGAAESNALAMHATMLSTWPPICYSLPETLATMHKIWQLRKQGLDVYFTQDAGANLKLLFLEKDAVSVAEQFPAVETIRVFQQ